VSLTPSSTLAKRPRVGFRPQYNDFVEAVLLKVTNISLTKVLHLLQFRSRQNITGALLWLAAIKSGK
jgi:hypothetical protein